ATPDPDIKVRTALDRAAVAIAGRFRNNPLIEAAIRHTIGTAYTQIGLYAQGQRQLETALAIQTELLGEENVSTSGTMYDLAHNLFRYQRRFTEAEPLMVKVLQIRNRLFGPSHPATLDAMNKLGDLYRFEGKYGPAEKLLSDALNGSRRVSDENAPQSI